jgi:hypothetical protein
MLLLAVVGLGVPALFWLGVSVASSDLTVSLIWLLSCAASDCFVPLQDDYSGHLPHVHACVMTHEQCTLRH